MGTYLELYSREIRIQEGRGWKWTKWQSFLAQYKLAHILFSTIPLQDNNNNNNNVFCLDILDYHVNSCPKVKGAASSEFGTYSLCEQRRFRQACASAQSRQNLRCSLIQAVSQEEPSDRKPDPWPLWMTGHAQLKFVMTECSKTQIRLTRPIGVFWR